MDLIMNDAIFQKIAVLSEEGFTERVKKMGVNFDDNAPSVQRLRALIGLAAKSVQRSYLNALEAEVVPEARRMILQEPGQCAPSLNMSSGPHHFSNGKGIGLPSAPSAMPLNNTSMSMGNAGQPVMYSHPLMYRGNSGGSDKNSQPLYETVCMSNNSIMGSVMLGSEDSDGLDMRANLALSVAPSLRSQQQQASSLAELIEVSCILEQQGRSMPMLTVPQQRMLLQQQQQQQQQQQHSTQRFSPSFVDGPPLTMLPTGGARSAMPVHQRIEAGPQYPMIPSPMAEGMAPKFVSLPSSVQMIILHMVQTYPVIRLHDFDDKVVNKLLFLVDRYSEQECLNLMDKLAARMRTKHSAMKNGAAYLDVAISSHLNVLLAQASCPGVTSLSEYAASRLPEVVHRALCSAIESNHWLDWDKLDLAVINLLCKLPEDWVLTKLQDIGSRSFRNVDNISACITTILSSKSSNR